MAPLLLGSGGWRGSQRGVEGGVQQATEGVTMVIWHPNVVVRDLGYREREVNQIRGCSQRSSKYQHTATC